MSVSGRVKQCSAALLTDGGDCRARRWTSFQCLEASILYMMSLLLLSGSSVVASHLSWIRDPSEHDIERASCFALRSPIATGSKEASYATTGVLRSRPTRPEIRVKSILPRPSDSTAVVKPSSICRQRDDTFIMQHVDVSRRDASAVVGWQTSLYLCRAITHSVNPLNRNLGT